ncbi:PLP-dependent transferase, partial [Delftia tsuruhatensis]
LVNIGDSKSLAAIPAETTHRLLSDEELARVGIAPGLVRLSIGIEHPQDLLADLAQALEQAQGHAVLAAERGQDREQNREQDRDQRLAA